MKVHPECEDFDCSVCRETAAVVEARLLFLLIIFLVCFLPFSLLPCFVGFILWLYFQVDSEKSGFPVF